MKDIVIVPTFDRPEYLWMCLENLRLAHGSHAKQIWICEDVHEDKPKDFTTQIDMLATIREAGQLFGRENVTYFGRAPHTSYGNSHNLLQALKDSIYTDARYVYIVEDDTMVMKDFFNWHEQAQQQYQPFVTCAGRINRSLNFQMNGPEAIDESQKDSMACVRSHKAYMSWATCFKREGLYWLLKHAPDKDGDDPWRPGFEQDMFIQDFIRDGHNASVWPYVPRAYHMGWYSYHRTAGQKFHGTLQEKVTALRRAIYSKAMINEMACLQEIDPFPREPIVWGEGDFYLKADFK